MIRVDVPFPGYGAATHDSSHEDTGILICVIRGEYCLYPFLLLYLNGGSTSSSPAALNPEIHFLILQILLVLAYTSKILDPRFVDAAVKSFNVFRKSIVHIINFHPSDVCSEDWPCYPYHLYFDLRFYAFMVSTNMVCLVLSSHRESRW